MKLKLASLVAKVCLVLTVLPAAAIAQDKSQQERRAFGSRIEDPDQDPNSTGVNGSRRVNRRIDTRIDSRLDMRLDRFVTPDSDGNSTYTPKVDDQTKR